MIIPKKSMVCEERRQSSTQRFVADRPCRSVGTVSYRLSELKSFVNARVRKSTIDCGGI